MCFTFNQLPATLFIFLLQLHILPWVNTEAAFQRYSLEKVFWKYAANLQENTHSEVWFQ